MAVRAFQDGYGDPTGLENAGDPFRTAHQCVVVAGVDIVADQANRPVAQANADVAAVLVLDQHQAGGARLATQGENMLDKIGLVEAVGNGETEGFAPEGTRLLQIRDVELEEAKA